MESPLGTVLANLFMGEKETKRNDCKNLTKEWFSFINVTLMIFFVCLDAENLFEFLNFHHKNIKFTLEKESHKSLSLLDILRKPFLSISLSKENISWVVYTV